MSSRKLSNSSLHPNVKCIFGIFFFYFHCLFVNKVDQGKFSVGIPWKYGKKKGKYQVKAYYKDLKEEMLNYEDLATEEYPNIVNKAAQYAQTGVAKSLKNRINSTPISDNDLMCIIMYCDYTELSRNFTLSFTSL